MYRSRVSSARRRDSSSCSFSRRRRSISPAGGLRLMGRHLADDEDERALAALSRLDPPRVDQQPLLPHPRKRVIHLEPFEVLPLWEHVFQQATQPGQPPLLAAARENKLPAALLRLEEKVLREAAIPPPHPEVAV